MKKTLETQLAALVATLEQLPEAQEAGNAAYCLLEVAKITAGFGTDQPLLIDVWQVNDVASRAEELGIPPPGRDRSRRLMASLNRHNDSEVGINQGVISSLLEAWDFKGGRL